jgi:hypothetical protein
VAWCLVKHRDDLDFTFIFCYESLRTQAVWLCRWEFGSLQCLYLHTIRMSTHTPNGFRTQDANIDTICTEPYVMSLTIIVGVYVQFLLEKEASRVQSLCVSCGYIPVRFLDLSAWCVFVRIIQHPSVYWRYVEPRTQ